MEGESSMTKNHGWVMYLSPTDTLLFASNDAARIWHADNPEAGGSFRVLYKRDAPVDKAHWDPHWDRLRGYALEEKLNVLCEGYVEAGEINWALVQELHAKNDYLTSWEFESDIWQELEFASDLLEHEAAVTP
jgi:hypothetical protein